MITLKKIPFIRIVLPMASGIAIQHIYHLDFVGCMALLGLSSLILVISVLKSVQSNYAYRYLSGLSMFVGYFSFGLLLMSFSTPAYLSPDSLKNKAYAFRINSVPTSKNKHLKFRAELLDRINNQDIGLVMVSLFVDDSPSAVKLNVGDEILIACTIKKPMGAKNPMDFDYCNYLENQGINYVVNARMKDVGGIYKHHRFSILELAHSCQKRIVDKLISVGLKNDVLGIAAALLIGDKDYLDQETQNNYANTGAMHVLSVSGLHVGIVYLLLSFLLKPLLQRKKNQIWINLLFIAVLWTFGFVSGLSPSIQRATLMFSLMIIGKQLGMQPNLLNILGVSAFILLIINPFMLFAVGFQLSYLAILGIVLIHPYVKLFFNPKPFLLKYLWEITAVSIAAQLATIPLSIYYFHQFPNYGLLTNLLVIPMAFLIMLVGVVFICFSFVPIFSDLLAYALKWLITFLNSTLSLVSTWPNAISDGWFLSIPEVLIIMVIIFSVVIALNLQTLKPIYGALTLIGFVQIKALINLPSKWGNQVWFYDVNDGFGMGLAQGNSRLLVLDDSTFLTSKLKNEEGYLNAQRTLFSSVETSNSFCRKMLDGNILQITQGKPILIVMNEIDESLYESIAFESLVVKNYHFSWHKLKNLRMKTIILCNSIPKSIRLKMKEINKPGTLIWSLPDQGAIGLNDV